MFSPRSIAAAVQRELRTVDPTAATENVKTMEQIRVVSGIAAAFTLSRVLRAFLFEVEPTDPVMLATAGVLFAAIGLLACWMPMRRATEVAPLEALRYD